MKKNISIIFLVIFIFSTVSFVNSVSAAKSSSYYRSAKTGRFTTKSYSQKNPYTTIKQTRR